jgi:hypothetical protein
MNWLLAGDFLDEQQMSSRLRIPNRRTRYYDCAIQIREPDLLPLNPHHCILRLPSVKPPHVIPKVGATRAFSSARKPA